MAWVPACCCRWATITRSTRRDGSSVPTSHTGSPQPPSRSAQRAATAGRARSKARCLSDHTIAIAGGLVDVVYAFGKTADQIRPYLVAGVGLYNWRLSAPGLAPSSETKAGFGGGAGVAYRVSSGSTRLFLEGKVTNVTVNGIYYVAVPIRVGLRFGAK